MRRVMKLFLLFVAFTSLVKANDERQSWCPADSLYHCDNPALIMNDPTVSCDWDSCRWRINRLKKDEKPQLCQAIVITDVERLPDYLEPCYWWEQRFGVFMPSAAPSTTPAPTVTAAPSSVPSDMPSLSQAPSALTDFPSAAPSFGPSTTPPVEPLFNFDGTVIQDRRDNRTEPVGLGDDFDLPVFTMTPTTTDIVDTVDGEAFETIFLTFLVTNSGLRRLVEVDQVELLVLTEEHLMAELRDSGVQDVTLTLAPVQSRQMTAATAVTEAVDGRIIFDDTVETVDAEEVQQMVEQAFQGEPMNRYLLSLKTAQDPTIASTQKVYMGLPSDMAPEPTSSETEDKLIFEWNVFWISIIAGGGFALFCLVLFFVCMWRYKVCGCFFRPIPDPTKSKSSVTQSPTNSDRVSPTAMDATEDKVGEKMMMDDGVSSVDEESRAGRYPMSEVTSVYSYIEQNTMMLDDQSYSLAPSMMYNLGEAETDDDDDESRMWSINDGATEATDTRSFADMYNGGRKSTPAVPPNVAAPAVNKVLIFSDQDDDDVSMVSELNTTKDMKDEDEKDEKTQPAIVSPYEKVDFSLSLNDYTYDDGSQASDVESLGGQRLPFTNMSLVEESASKKSVNSESTGSESTHLRKNKENQNIINDELALHAAESSDDDSSLFMGPDLVKKSPFVLQDKDRLNQQRLKRHAFRMGPQPMGGKVLTTKERLQMGLSVRRSKSTEEKESSSFSLPRAYGPTEDTTNDDASVGSGVPGKYPIESMASF